MAERHRCAPHSALLVSRLSPGYQAPVTQTLRAAWRGGDAWRTASPSGPCAAWSGQCDPCGRLSSGRGRSHGRTRRGPIAADV